MAGKETVKGTFGNEPIELNNAATETTLTAMLKLAQKDSAVLAEMAKKAGVDAKKVQDSLDKNAQSNASSNSGGSGGGLGFLGGVAKMAGGVLGDMAGMAMSVVGSLGSFIGALNNGTTKASELALAFKDLPLGIGVFAQLLSMASKQLEENVAIYRGISGSGAGLVGDINYLRTSATQLGLTQQEYSQIFVNAGEAMVKLGGSAAAGGKRLDMMNKAFIDTNQAKYLLGLGYSYEQLNSMLPNYIKSTGDSLDASKGVANEMRRLQKASAEYGEDLDFVARATGQNREELQRKKQEIAQEASWQMWLLKQPAAMQTAYDQLMSRQIVTGGKGLVDYTKAKLMGFAGGFSKESQAFGAMFGDAADMVEQQITVAQKGLTSDQRREEFNKIQVKQIRSMIGNIDGMDTAIMAMGQQAGLSGKGMEEFVSLTNKWRNKEGGFAKTEAEMMDDLRKAHATQAASASDAQKALASEKAARDASVAVQNALNPLMVELSGITIKLINEFTKILNENMPAIKNALAHVVNFIEGAFKDPHIIVANIKGLFQKLLGEMLDLATNSWWGRKIFGGKEDVENIQDRSKISFGQGISKTKYMELEAQEKAGKITAENKEVLADYRKTLMEAAAALARQQERGNVPLNKNSDQVKKEAEAMARATFEAQNAGRSFDSLNDPAKNAKILEAMNRLEEQWAQGVANDRANIMSGKYTYEGLMEALQRKDYLNVEKRAGGSPGGMPEDWGRESLVKLHGKEAVLTEDQLDSMKKGGNTSIELADLKIVAEGIITLNKQAAIQNQILTQMVDNQQRMITRSMGNRLMV
jgi:hypothetical protein